MRILVTAGATREPIDDIRFLTNLSTGLTGATLADYLAEQGHEVGMLLGQGAIQPGRASWIREFGSFASLESALRETLPAGKFHCVIQAAAVSDYSISSVRIGDRRLDPEVLRKLDSTEDLLLHLKPNPKLISRIREFSRGGDPFVVGFKLTSGASADQRQSAVSRLWRSARPDWIVHNDLSERGPGPYHRFDLYQGEKWLERCETALEMARALEAQLRSRVG